MIALTNLTFSYTNKPPFLINKVNLNINAGSYVSIIGENGSCKSTLLKLMLGLLSPTSGNVNIKTNKIGYVPQRVDGFNSQFPISVNEILLNHLKISKSKDLSLIKKSLNIVSMVDFKDNLIGSLSGGQQQRVFIARALLSNPDLIVLDEPSTGVDSKSQKTIYSLLKKLNDEGKTIVSVEHNLDTALLYSTHIVEVISGTPILYTKEEFLNKSSFRNDNIIGM
ncbi:metal ABC transporter ATP-binding protein [uncultured Clostridium sp.]|uniref:metal ABC transporter ATP-binding protein n=1 Tax=uncultured Clostridium sp. TaxID=59620 RepID=UPI0026114415|nr:metal ABC transporter ATP-binding protein [uncultured Clostridium sp.]